MYKETIHDGSVSYSVIRSDPEPGKGKHYKAPGPRARIRRAAHLAKMKKPYTDQLHVDMDMRELSRHHK